MELILAKKILELDLMELVGLLTKLMMEDRDAYNALKEKIEEL